MPRTAYMVGGGPDGLSGIPALIFLFALGALGYAIFRKLKWPMAALLGSISTTALLAVTGHFPAAPLDTVSAVCKVLIGMMMGRRMNRNALRLLGQMVLPAILVSVWMVLLSVAGGELLAFLAGIPLSTALIGTTTGGVSEMAIFALSANYDVATITVLQVTRLIMVLVSIPWIAKRWRASASAKSGGDFSEPKVTGLKEIGDMPLAGIALTLLCALAGGMLFSYLRVPAGMMLGSLLGSAIVVLVSNRIYPFPPLLLALAQIGIGLSIARQFGPEQLRYLTDLRFVSSLLAVSTLNIAATLLLAYIVQKITHWDPLTCLLATSAGGLSQMVVVAEEMGADALTTGILHLARYLAIVSVMPFLITLMLG